MSYTAEIAEHCHCIQYNFLSISALRNKVIWSTRALPLRTLKLVSSHPICKYSSRMQQNSIIFFVGWLAARRKHFLKILVLGPSHTFIFCDSSIAQK
jgi:hypothetical protein